MDINRSGQKEEQGRLWGSMLTDTEEWYKENAIESWLKMSCFIIFYHGRGNRERNYNFLRIGTDSLVMVRIGRMTLPLENSGDFDAEELVGAGV